MISHDFSSQGETPLHKAAYNGSAEAVKTLLEAGADMDAKDTVVRWPQLCCFTISVGPVQAALGRTWLHFRNKPSREGAGADKDAKDICAEAL